MNSFGGGGRGPKFFLLKNDTLKLKQVDSLNVHSSFIFKSPSFPQDHSNAAREP